MQKIKVSFLCLINRSDSHADEKEDMMKVADSDLYESASDNEDDE